MSSAFLAWSSSGLLATANEAAICPGSMRSSSSTMAKMAFFLVASSVLRAWARAWEWQQKLPFRYFYTTHDTLDTNLFGELGGAAGERAGSGGDGLRVVVLSGEGQLLELLLLLLGLGQRRGL